MLPTGAMEINLASGCLLSLRVYLTLLYFLCSCVLGQQLFDLPASILPLFIHLIASSVDCLRTLTEPTLSSWSCARCWALSVKKMWPLPGLGEVSSMWLATIPVRCADKEAPTGFMGALGGLLWPLDRSHASHQQLRAAMDHLVGEG